MQASGTTAYNSVKPAICGKRQNGATVKVGLGVATKSRVGVATKTRVEMPQNQAHDLSHPSPEFSAALF